MTNIFLCQECGQEHPKWVGQCQTCGTWNSIYEEKSKKTVVHKGKVLSSLYQSLETKAISLEEIPLIDFERLTTGISEWDLVLGGGLVPASVILLGGEPGVGKSTLLLQVVFQYIKRHKKILYIAAEESPSQIGLRLQRLMNIESFSSSSLKHQFIIYPQPSLEKILQKVDELSCDMIVIDSIQTIYSEEFFSPPGTMAQLRECTFHLISKAKQKGVATFLVGHVTKEGALSGPKTLEHMVDVVLYLESFEGSLQMRALRCNKNRFGSTSVLGLFEMKHNGLMSLPNPSSLLLESRQERGAGSAIGATLAGERPLLVEIQALVTETNLAMPRRMTMGVLQQKLSILVAVLEKRCHYKFYNQDVFINIAGGMKFSEPILDLALAAAILSSYHGTPLSKNTLFIGEVGLLGEVRSMNHMLDCLREAEKLGLEIAYVPQKLIEQKNKFSLDLRGLGNIMDLHALFVGAHSPNSMQKKK